MPQGDRLRASRGDRIVGAVDTAQLAIVVTGAVGLGAPALSAMFGWLREKQHAKRERTANDLADLRSLLDGLLPVMFDHTNRLVSLERWIRDQTLRHDRDDRAPALADTRRELYSGNARLVIRRGRDDGLVVSLGHYLRLTDDAKVEVDQAYDEHDLFDQSDEQLAERALSYWEAYEGFADRCKTVVGNLT